MRSNIDRRQPLLLAAALIALCVCVGCAAKGANQSSQYQAAVVSDDFAHAMSSLQGEEYTLFQSGVIAASGHAQFKSVALDINTTGQQADQLIGQGNFTGALPLLNSVLTKLQSLSPQTLGIKDQQSQPLYESSLTAAIAALEIKISSVQQQVASPQPVAGQKGTTS